VRNRVRVRIKVRDRVRDRVRVRVRLFSPLRHLHCAEYRKLIFGTASQYTCATKTLLITVFGMNSKRFGCNVASGAQCDIPINSAIQNTLTKLNEN